MKNVGYRYIEGSQFRWNAILDRLDNSQCTQGAHFSCENSSGPNFWAEMAINGVILIVR